MNECTIEYKNVKPLANFNISDSNKLLYKYIPYKYFVESLEKMEISFVSPKTWTDPFELFFFNESGTTLKNNFIVPQLFCICLTENSYQNEDAFWNIYCKGSKDKIIRVCYNMVNFLTELDLLCSKENYTAYIGKMNYAFTQDEIKEVAFPKKNSSEKIKKFHSDTFNHDFGIEKYLQLLLLKRRAFEYEREVRIFLIDNNKNSSESVLLKKNFGFSNNIIKRVKISPKMPFNYDDILFRYYSGIQNVETKIYKSELQKVLDGIINSRNIQQSHLYDGVKTIDYSKIEGL